MHHVSRITGETFFEIAVYSTPGARQTTDVICMHLRLLINVAESEEKHERVVNSTQALKELEDTSQFVYLMSSFSLYSDCNISSQTLLAFQPKIHAVRIHLSLLIHNLLSPAIQVAN